MMHHTGVYLDYPPGLLSHAQRNRLRYKRRAFLRGREVTNSHLEALVEVEKSKSNISMHYLQNQIKRLSAMNYSVNCDAPCVAQRSCDVNKTVTEISPQLPFVFKNNVLDGKRDCEFEEVEAYGIAKDKQDDTTYHRRARFLPLKKVLDGSRICEFDLRDVEMYGSDTSSSGVPFIPAQEVAVDDNIQSNISFACSPAPSPTCVSYSEDSAKDTILHLMLSHYIQNSDDDGFNIDHCVESTVVRNHLIQRYGGDVAGLNWLNSVVQKYYQYILSADGDELAMKFLDLSDKLGCEIDEALIDRVVERTAEA